MKDEKNRKKTKKNHKVTIKKETFEHIFKIYKFISFVA